MTTRWVIDKSAFARLSQSRDPEEWARRTERGLVQVTTVTLLEIGYSARAVGDWQRALRGPPIQFFPVVPMTPRIEDRAIEVQGLLVRLGMHRAPSVADLLIAAAAERSGCTVLHLDKDFELIAEVTGQPTERLSLGPAG